MLVLDLILGGDDYTIDTVQSASISNSRSHVLDPGSWSRESSAWIRGVDFYNMKNARKLVNYLWLCHWYSNPSQQSGRSSKLRRHLPFMVRTPAVIILPPNKFLSLNRNILLDLIAEGRRSQKRSGAMDTCLRGPMMFKFDR